MSELRKLFDKYKCDKGYKHGYEEVYEPLLQPIRNKKRPTPPNILEVGIFKGASTRAFLDYMVAGRVACIDLFERVAAEDIDILQSDRCKYLKGSSMDPEIVGRVKNELRFKYDVIIDDGAHWPAANKATFDNLWQFVKPGGTYIIEDVWPFDDMTAKQRNHPWLLKSPEKYNEHEYEKFMQSINNSGGTLQRFDLRSKSGEGDSYIMAITK